MLGLWRAPQRGARMQNLAGANRELKQRRFWVTHVNGKWAFFSFNKPWRNHICIANKCLNSYRDDLPKKFFKITAKNAKSPVPVDIRSSKTSLFKHPIFRRAPFLPIRLTALRSPRMCMTTTWKYLTSRHSFVEDVNTRQRLFLFSRTSGQSFRIQLYKTCQHLTNWTRWNEGEKVWSSANSLFLSDLS